METTENAPKVFKGQNIYAEVATRNEDVLGISISYRIHTKDKVGYLLIRFAAYRADEHAMHFHHFEPRGFNEYALPVGELIKGVQLNKLAVPVFNNAPSFEQFREVADKNGVFHKLAEWLNAQIEAEGFTPTIFEMVPFLQNFFPASAVGTAELILDFPSLGTTPSQEDKSQPN